MSQRQSWWLALALVSLIGAAAIFDQAPRARAQSPTGTADEAEVAFRLGNRAYGAGRYEEALAHYFASYRTSPNLNVLFNIASCYEAMNANVEAYRYYREHLAASPPESTLRARSEAAMKRLAGRVALIDVRATAPGAVIYLDRVDLGAYGAAPRVVPVQPGTYTIIVEAPGHERFVLAAVRASVGTPVVVEAALVPEEATLELAGTPAGARVMARTPAGLRVGSVPGRMKIGAGEVELEIAAPGHVVDVRRLTVAPRASARVDVALQPLTGAVVLSADEPGALVRLDGRPVGFTPTVLERVPVGEHTLEVQLGGYRTWRETITVEADGRHEVFASLFVASDVEAASRTLESALDAPSSVTVIPELELRAFGATHPADALVGVRGAYASDDGVYVAGGFRGFSPFGDYGNRVLVQLDGHTLNESWYGSSFLGYEGLVGVDMLERIEVVRGPGSTVHGAGPIFGVLNLVTPEARGEVAGSIRLSATGPRTARIAASAQTPLHLPDSALWTWGGFLYEQPGTFVSTSSGEVASEVGEVRAGSAITKLRIGEWHLTAFFNQHRNQLPNAPFGATLGDTRTYILDRRAFVDVSWRRELAADLRIDVGIDFDHSYYDAVYAYADEDGGALSESYVGHGLGLEGQLLWRESEELRVLGGVGWRFNFVDRARGFALVAPGEPYVDEEHPFHRLFLYGQVDLDVGDALTLTGGLRFDGVFFSDLTAPDGSVDDVAIPTINPKLALRWRPSPEDNVKLILGRAFRAPSIGELTYNDQGFTQVPAPGLDPEIVYTAEVEWTRRLGRDLSLIVGGFYSNMDGLIQLTGSGEESDPLQYINRSRAVGSIGGELELRREFRQSHMWALTYAIQRTRVGSVFEGERLPNSPAHLLSARGVVPLIGRTLAMTWRLAVESGRADRNGRSGRAAVLLDVGLWGDVGALGLEYGLQIRNLLDWRVAYPVGEEFADLAFAGPGRHITANLAYRF